jgi:Na+-transporting methylmalonyl-CoA/oxaloacetate decarboxylase gamma subunit
MKDALFISAVGMGLVFVGLLALWGMMAVVVKLTNIKKIIPAMSKSISSLPGKDVDLERKRKAAAVAVTTAVALMDTSFTVSSHKEKEGISPWQAANRAHQTSINNHPPRRKD